MRFVLVVSFELEFPFLSLERIILIHLITVPLPFNTSCLYKTLERMINTPLIWFLVSNGHITDFQCGFRSRRSTVDHLVRLETFVREAFIKKEHLTAVF